MRAHAVMAGQTLIHSDVNLYSWRDWMTDHPGVELQIDRGPCFDHSFMAVSAACDGIGVALESYLLIERELDAGRLILPFDSEGPRLACASCSSCARSPPCRRSRPSASGS